MLRGANSTFMARLGQIPTEAHCSEPRSARLIRGAAAWPVRGSRLGGRTSARCRRAGHRARSARPHSPTWPGAAERVSRRLCPGYWGPAPGVSTAICPLLHRSITVRPSASAFKPTPSSEPRDWVGEGFDPGVAFSLEISLSGDKPLSRRWVPVFLLGSVPPHLSLSGVPTYKVFWYSMRHLETSHLTHASNM